MERDVLQHYNLTARVGEVTLIQGENGYGKSTLVKLLLRLYDPQQGQILINGTDIRCFSLDELRANVAVLFQDFARYALTAEENIAFDNTKPATQAAALAHADTIIEGLPNGYYNMLGRTFDGGTELSMGQWQRIALARLLYTDAPVLVLDEPTAWMDIPTRELFMQTIDRIKHNKIIIMITHT